ncbi:MAG TPA: hypothetical protein VF017_23190 [Thermoanaerobaculia bacterium]|nr:hypothetical protein [Thermoanaerobaculia bacterium]
MIRKTFTAALAALFLLPLAAPLAAEEAAPTLEQVIDKNLAARGGKDKLTAMKSVRITGKMTMGPGMEAPFVLEWKRPEKMRMEFTIQGMTGVQAFDGESGWMVMPFMGKTTPEKMPEDAAKEVREQADFEGTLVNWKDKGHTVELLGVEEVEGTPAYKLKVTKKGGEVETLFIDTDSNLEFKSAQKREQNGQEMEVESIYGDYKEVAGLMMPHSIEARAVGMPMSQVMTIEKIEVDADIADSRFVMPAAEPAPAPAPPSN